jgi:hypothetical protein
MLVIELNEFNRDLIDNVARRLGLRHLRTILDWHHTGTWTEDRYDSGFLEPWAQWVSVHTGVQASDHSVKNLGDVPNLIQEQIWETWSQRGATSIVWGVMNGNRRAANLCKVFIPDPWTFSEDTYPAEYQGLIDLPRYLAKNYLDFSKAKAFRKGMRLLTTVVRLTRWRDFVDGLLFLQRGLRKFGPTNVVFIVFFEYLSAMAFIRAVEEHGPDAAIIFINMLAHVQHHYWTTLDGADCPQIEFAATAVNQIFGKIILRCDGLRRRVAVLNALSQGCTNDEPPWILYRPNNHAKLMETIGVKAARVEPLMTYDAHLFFANAEDAVIGASILRSAKIIGKSLFFVELDEHDPLKLFYRVAMTDPLQPDAEFTYRNSAARFSDHFTAIVRRTGKHLQKGDLFTNFDTGLREAPNHEVSKLLSQADNFKEGCLIVRRLISRPLRKWIEC